MKIGNVSFGAKIDKNTMDFLVKAREKGLETKEMETLMKQTSPDGDIVSAIDFRGDLLFMYNTNRGFYNILPGQVEKPYKTNQTTINMITERLKEIKKEDKTSTDEKVRFIPIYKRDHRAELKAIFGEPKENIFDDAIIEQDY